MAEQAWGVDTETTGLDPYKSKLLSVQIGTKHKQFMIDARKVNFEPLRPFFESMEHKKAIHHAKFDYKTFKVATGIEIENMRCTMLGAQILEMGRKKWGFSLAAQVLERLGITMNKEIRESFIGHTGPFTNEQKKYALEDVAHLVPLAAHISSDLIRDGLAKTFLLECNAIPSIADMELEGFILDVPHWEQVMKDNKANQVDIKGEIDEIAKQYLPVDLFGDVNVNYASSDQVIKLYEQMRLKVKVWDRDSRSEKEIPIGKGKGQYKHSGKKELKSIAHLPIVKLVEKYRSYNVLINTFGQPYINAIHPTTGRIHGEFDQLGTETGRLASRADVNFLNLPRDVRFRHGFTAGPGYVIETDDYAGCELRIWAELSGDPGLLHAFQEGIDVHCYVATKLYRVEVTKSNENKRLRSPAKNLNFGIAYGMGPPTLYEDLNSQGFTISREETKKLYARYEAKFKVGVKFLREAGRQAAEQGFLANINGRRRYWHLPDHRNTEKFPLGKQDWKYKFILSSIAREGGNHAIQSVNADITKLGMTKIRTYRKENNIRTNFSNQVYDEIVTRTHEDDTQAFHPIKQKLMIEAGEHWLKKVPVEVDGTVGPCWTK